MGSKENQSVEIGIKHSDRKEIAKGINALLADTASLYLKTHAFHWNVEGPMFQTLHLMFEAQYNELWLALDVIAERIRALGFPVEATFKQFLKHSSIAESDENSDSTKMVRLLVEGHESASRTARALTELVHKASDEATADLLTQRLRAHEKTAWMLRSLLA